MVKAAAFLSICPCNKKGESMTTRILVIEDNPTNLELVVYLLKQFGYETLTAMDGQEGLALAEKEKPDLIICDIQLPKLNGYEVAKSLSRNPEFSDVPLIAVTAYSMVGDRDAIMSAGFNGYISKPIDPDSFVKQIEMFLTKKQHSNHVSPSIKVSKEKEKIIQSQSKSRGTILVVDDSPSNRQLFQTLLESEGFKVEMAGRISQAMGVLDKTTPELILSDLHMPNANGLDFLRTVKVKKALKGIPFIIISNSNPKESEQKECLSLGVVKFIVSPIEPRVFLKTVKEVWSDSRKSKKKKNLDRETYGNDSDS